MFHSVHVEAAARIARLARRLGIKRLVHLSGIGADTACLPPLFAAEAKVRRRCKTHSLVQSLSARR
jgi:hypothetical protein